MPGDTIDARDPSQSKEDGRAGKETVGLIRRRGRRRAGWTLYRSAHLDPEQGGMARFLPAWGHRPSMTPPEHLVRLRPEAPAPVREDAPPPADPPAPPIDGRPFPDLPAADFSVAERTAAPPPNGLRRPKGIAADAPPISPPVEAPSADRPADITPRGLSHPAVAELTGTQILPPAAPGEGSSLAALFGFGETEAAFDGDRRPARESRRRFGNRRRTYGAPVDQTAPAAGGSSDDPWSQLLSLNNVSADPDSRKGNTGDTIKRLWDASAEFDMDRELLSDDLPDIDPSLRSTRRIRWSLVISVVVLAGLIGATVKVVGDIPAREARAREGQYTAAAVQLAGAVLPVEESLTAEGLLSDSGLSTLTGQIDILDGAARAAATLASEQLPGNPIVGSEVPVEELTIQKQLLESASIRALGVGRRVGDAMAYSLSLSTSFALPDLPAEAPRDEVGGIAERLSISIVETRQVLGGLPDDPLFGDFRQQASDAVTMVEESQANYIAALLEGDDGRAAAVSGAMHDSMAVLREALNAPLVQVQAWALDQISELRTTMLDLSSIVAA